MNWNAFRGVVAVACSLFADTYKREYVQEWENGKVTVRCTLEIVREPVKAEIADWSKPVPITQN